MNKRGALIFPNDLFSTQYRNLITNDTHVRLIIAKNIIIDRVIANEMKKKTFSRAVDIEKKKGNWQRNQRAIVMNAAAKCLCYLLFR